MGDLSKPGLSKPGRRGLSRINYLRPGFWKEAVDDEELANIRRYISQERAFGNPRFQLMVEKTLGHHAAVRANGRPVKTGTVKTGTEGVKSN